MHLSLQTDYGLRVLMLLASTDRQMSVDEIARSYGISRNHLAKVAQRLQSSGYVETVRRQRQWHRFEVVN
ncbi:Rrf2 family transcriptional regulator [Novosphingobium sp.]|jgi:Rrf2 family nitric oxide-sensitive transcriptional repressor|uniref:RrF2 family transcriptional regulator n=1 Tax=Novosphingobium sp. TaxID=1874826 RepID=UPI0009E83CEA|nr:Rrf2 family transcriptional regulator [Novosphingobium sp.]